MENIEQEVLQWHKETFPNATVEAIEEKVAEELHEFLTVINNTGTPVEYWDEFADVVITHMAFIKKTSNGEVTLADIVRRKLDILKDRKWGPELPDGNRIKVIA